MPLKASIQNMQNIARFVEMFQKGDLEYRNGEIWSTRQGRLPFRCEYASPAGYMTLRMSGGHRGITWSAQSHRIIWWLFNGPIEDPALQINHLNAIRNDNRIENLELVTHLENIRHRVKLFGVPWATKRRNGYKLSDDDIRSIRWLKSFCGLDGQTDQYQIAQTYGISQQMVSKIQRNERFKTTVSPDS